MQTYQTCQLQTLSTSCCPTPLQFRFANKSLQSDSRFSNSAHAATRLLCLDCCGRNTTCKMPTWLGTPIFNSSSRMNKLHQAEQGKIKFRTCITISTHKITPIQTLTRPWPEQGKINLECLLLSALTKWNLVSRHDIH